MNAQPSLSAYLIRESFLRWWGRPSVPCARLAVAAGLAIAALLVLASFALGVATLEARIAEFGLDTLVVRTPVRRAVEPAPTYPPLAKFGRTLTLTLPAAAVGLDTGRQVPIAVAGDETLRELAALGMPAGRLPLLITSTLPAGMPVRASLGPWSCEAQTLQATGALGPLGVSELLIIRPADFPWQATLPGTAVTLFVRSPSAPPLDQITAALATVFANNPANPGGSSAVQSALPLLREIAALEAAWRGYAAVLTAVLAAMIAIVFGSGALLEYEATAYATALLRSFGVNRSWIWLQRYSEAAALANAGCCLGLTAAWVIGRSAWPQLAPHLAATGVIIPVLVALNLGAGLAALPVARALQRPVGLVLQ